MSGARSCYAITAPGLEGLTASELSALGIPVQDREPGGVTFLVGTAQLYAANLRLRTASRVVVRLATFPARAFYELERKAKRVPWEAYVARGGVAQFHVTSRKSRLYHGDAVAERLGSAAGTQTAAEGGEAGTLFLVRIVRDVVTISADSSGELLHRRGYRQALAKAPIRETLAAAMLMGTGYDGEGPLLDPFCGSGTIAVEAAMMARRMAPGLGRSFGLERWPDFDADIWLRERAAAMAETLPRAGAPIVGADRDAGAVRAARSNVERAGVASDVDLVERAVEELQSPAGPGFVVTNPPYGVRIGEAGDLESVYGAFGARLRDQCPGWRVGVLVAEGGLEHCLGLPLACAWESVNGGIPVRLMVGRVPA